jgi:hypothetical protein
MKTHQENMKKENALLKEILRDLVDIIWQHSTILGENNADHLLDKINKL